MDSISARALQRSIGKPYPGLRPFELEDRPRFFGRELQEQELLVRLDRNRIATVVGGSGCGKSSLIRAGLLPQLTNLGIPSAGRYWEPVVFVPGKTLDQTEARSPLQNLARAFLQTLERQQAEAPAIDAVIDTFNQIDGFGRLVDAYSDQRRIRPGDERTEPNYLFVIDQFEELFSEQVRDSLEARSLVARIEDAWKRPHPRVFIVITMRSEHLNDCTAYPDFPEVINDTSYLVRRLHDSELKEAIVGPVFTLCEQVAVAQDLDEIELPEFELDLTELLLREVEALAHDPDHLPLFQHCLFWLWHIACDEAADTALPRSIDRGHLARAIGLGDQRELAKHAGKILERCLDFHARSAYGSLDEACQRKAERLFRVFAARDELQTYKRTPLALSRLDEIGLTLDDYQNIEKSINSPHPYLRETAAGEADIYHEALIRKWDQFRKWINQEYERAARYHEVCSRLARWRSATVQQRDHRLLAEEKAQAAVQEGFADATMPALLLERLYDWKVNPLRLQSPAELSKAQAEVSGFIRASVEYHTEQRRQDEEKAAAELAARRRRRMQAFTLLIIIAALSWIAAAIGFDLQKQARARELASRALLAMKQNPAKSAHIAVAALNEDPSSRMGMHALRESLATLEIAHTERILSHPASVTDARFSPDGTFIIVASRDEVRTYDTATYEPKNAFQRKDVLEAWLILDNSVLLTRTQDGRAQLESIGSGTLRTLACDGPEDSVYTVRPSPDGRHVAAGCYLGQILVWDVKEPTEAANYRFMQNSEVAITTLAFDPDSTFFAAGDADGDVYVWKLGHSQAWIGEGEIKHENYVREVSFHPDSPDVLVTAGEDRKAKLWQLDLEKHRIIPVDEGKPAFKLEHNHPVISAKFATNAGVVTVAGKTALIWVGEQKKQARGHDDWVLEANTSPDGKYLVTASADGTARIWSTRTAGTIATLRGHRGYITRASFSPTDRNLVITASSDGTVRIWRLKVPETLWSADGWVLSARFDPDGKRVAAAGEGGPGEGGKVVFLKIAEARQSTAQDAEPEALEAEPPPMVGANLSKISWSRDRRYLAGRQNQQGFFSKYKLILWDVGTRKLLAPKLPDGMEFGAFSQGTDRLATVGFDTPVIVWDAKSIDSPDGLKEITRIGKNGIRDCVAISPDGNWVAACEGRSVILWRCCEPDAKPDELKAHLGEVNSIEFSPDSKSLVTTSRDQTARIWTVMDPSSFKTLTGHTASVAYASFHPSGKQVATAGADVTIRVWDVDTAEEIATLPWHGESVNEVSFGGDGRILSASDDGSVKLGACETCNLSLDNLRSRVEQYAHLTKDDRDWVKDETDVRMGWIWVLD